MENSYHSEKGREIERADSIIWCCFWFWGENGDRKWESGREENINQLRNKRERKETTRKRCLERECNLSSIDEAFNFELRMEIGNEKSVREENNSHVEKGWEKGKRQQERDV